MSPSKDPVRKLRELINLWFAEAGQNFEHVAAADVLAGARAIQEVQFGVLKIGVERKTASDRNHWGKTGTASDAHNVPLRITPQIGATIGAVDLDAHTGL